MVQAVLAIEDRRFYDHPGVDVIRTIGAIVTNLRGEKKYLVGGSTITQQLVKNFFLTPEKSLKRKLAEQYMAIILERKASKDEILEMYLNEVYLGQRGSFAVHGVAEAARLFFGKDVSNLTLAEAATIAGVIQSPYTWSPFASAERSRERRNVVLRAMADEGFVSAEAAERAAAEPIQVVQRALDAQAPYFVDYVGQTLGEQYPGLTETTGTLDVYTTLDIHLQRIAQESLRDGLARVDELLAKKKRGGQAQARAHRARPAHGRGARAGRRPLVQPVAVQPRRQRAAASPARCSSPSSTWPPSSAPRPRAAPTSRRPRSWTTSRRRSRSGRIRTRSGRRATTRTSTTGSITLRRALALSRNVATIKVAEMAGFDKVAGLWQRIGVGTDAHAYPSITLGVFEATPIEIATAYTLLPERGVDSPAPRALAHRRGHQDRSSRPIRRSRRSRARTRRTSSST